MARTVCFLGSYVAVLAASTLLFVASFALIGTCRRGATGAICEVVDTIGYGVSAIVASILALLFLFAAELWLIDRRMVQLGQDPASQSVATKLFRSRFLVSLLFGAPRRNGVAVQQK